MAEPAFVTAMDHTQVDEGTALPVAQWPLSLTPAFLSMSSYQHPMSQEYLDLQKKLSEVLRQVRHRKTILAVCAHAGHAHFSISTCTSVPVQYYHLAPAKFHAGAALQPSLPLSLIPGPVQHHPGALLDGGTGPTAIRRGDAGDSHSHGGGGW